MTNRSSFLSLPPFAALLLATVVSLLATPHAHAGDPFRLDRIGIVRFTPLGADKLVRQNGVLHLDGRIQWRGSTEVARPANTPDYALNRPLLPSTALSAYLNLGTFSLQGFWLQEGGMTMLVGEEAFKAVAINDENYIFDGSMTNLSTRAVLQPGGDGVIAGFVIENRARAVLVRVIGPGLAKFGLSNAAPDPALTLRRGSETLLANDNWSSGPNAGLVAAATEHVGAFPLTPNSADAAAVVILAPGVYTLQADIAAPGVAGGAVLVEIYTLPDDALYE